MRKTILKVFIIVLTFVQCSTGDSKKEKRKHRADSLALVHKRQQDIKDSIWKTSANYIHDLKKIAKLKDKYNKIIDNCYGWTTVGRKKVRDYTFSMNKYQDAMAKHKLNKIENKHADYEGYDSDFYVKIEMGKATATSEGWVQHFDVTVRPK